MVIHVTNAAVYYFYTYVKTINLLYFTKLSFMHIKSICSLIFVENF